MSPPHCRSRLRLIAALSLTGILSASCASSTPPLVARPNLPAPPADLGKPVPLPAPTPGKSLKTFSLENRAAAHQANRRLENDRAFYHDVHREYGVQKERQ